MNEFGSNGWEGAEFLQEYVGALKGLLTNLQLEAVERVAETLDQACRRGRTVFCVGNGGSAATASHFATDLTWGRRERGEQRPKAISLTANVPLMTALSNDVGYADVFVEQLRSLFDAGDVVFAISASGNSENVLRAVQYANEHEGISVGLVGFDGGKLKPLCHTCIYVETPPGMYELVEDVHHAICHMLSSYLKRNFTRRAETAG
jgi:D-sedoheptulose 7-phosphate isomerase